MHPETAVEARGKPSELVEAVIEASPLPETEESLSKLNPFVAVTTYNNALRAVETYTDSEIFCFFVRKAGGTLANPLVRDFDDRFFEVLSKVQEQLLDFIADRLRVQLRAEGARHDVLAAVFAAIPDDDLVRLLARTGALAAFLATPDGADLLAASRRAANILRIEDKKDGPHQGPVDPALLHDPAEQALANALDEALPAIETAIAAELFEHAMLALAKLRPKLDTFFNDVTVNAPDPALRANRLNLLARIGAAMAAIADFSRIEG